MFFGSVMTIFARDGIMGDGRREILPEIALGYCGWVMVVPGRLWSLVAPKALLTVREPEE